MSETGLWKKELKSARFKLSVNLLIMLILAIGIPLLYEYTVNILQNSSMPENLAKDIKLLKDYEYWIWSQWFGKNLLQIGTIIAIVFGAGNISSEVSRKTIYFLLTKPLTRHKVFTIKYLVNLLYLEAVIIISSLALYVTILTTGKEYSAVSFFENLALFAVGIVIVYSIAVLNSTFFDQTLKSILISVLVVLILSIPGYFESVQNYSLFFQMKGGPIIVGSGFPWLPTIIMVLVSVIIYKLALHRFVKRDW